MATPKSRAPRDKKASKAVTAATQRKRKAGQPEQEPVAEVKRARTHDKGSNDSLDGDHRVLNGKLHKKTEEADEKPVADDDDGDDGMNGVDDIDGRTEEDMESAPQNEVKKVKKSSKKSCVTSASGTKSKNSKKSKTASANAKAKPTSKAKPASKVSANGVKKRKTRTLADKKLENAPVATPFYSENGSSSTSVDDLSVLRGMWQLPAAAHLLWLLQQPLTLRVCATMFEYEVALLNPETSAILEDVFTKLLLRKRERDCLAPGIGLKYEWWNKQLREYYRALYEQWYGLLRKAGERVPASASAAFLGSESSESDSESTEDRDVELSDDEWLTLDILKSRLEGLGVENPLQRQTFSELPVELRCKILLNLAEAVMDDPANTDYIRQMEEDDLRVEPLGRDRVGNWFYYFPQFYEERRLYRLQLEDQQWGLWAKGDDAFEGMLTGMKAIPGRKLQGEQELIDHLEVIVEQMQEEAVARERQTEKATRKAILEAIPRKRSARIQVKKLEEMEKREEVEAQRVMTQEEIVEMKRAELLRKVEKDAEREERERERDARRVAKEEKEREAAQAEREQRRQRRMELVQEEDPEQLRLEEEKKKQDDARKLRALQRQAAEAEVARVEADANADDTTTTKVAPATASDGISKE